MLCEVSCGSGRVACCCRVKRVLWYVVTPPPFPLHRCNDIQKYLITSTKREGVPCTVAVVLLSVVLLCCDEKERKTPKNQKIATDIYMSTMTPINRLVTTKVAALAHQMNQLPHSLVPPSGRSGEQPIQSKRT